MSELDSIVSLQKTLSELSTARRHLDGVPNWMTELHAEHSSRKSEIEAEEASAAEAEKNRRDAEAAVADSQEKLKHFQAQVSQVTTQREYGALLKEIDTVKEKIKQAEEQALSALTANEEAQQKLEQLEADFQDLDQRYSSELSKWEGEKPAVESRAKELEEEAERLRAAISRPMLSLFKRLYDRTDGDALAEVHDMANAKGTTMWHCSSCSFNVRPMIAMEVRSGKILHCDSCKRILHWVEPPEEESDEDEDI